MIESNIVSTGISRSQIPLLRLHQNRLMKEVFVSLRAPTFSFEVAKSRSWTGVLTMCRQQQGDYQLIW
jgi:hypothetical protein